MSFYYFVLLMNIAGYSSLSLFLVLWLCDIYYNIQLELQNVNLTQQQEREQEVEAIKDIPYENKYWEKYNQFSNDFVFSQEDEENEITKMKELLDIFEKQKQIELLEVERDLELEDEVYKLSSEEETEMDKKTELQNKYKELKEKQANFEEMKKEAVNHKITELLNRLKYSHVMELTPLGNVAMSYNHVKGSFEYYSDHAIPYRFLESVARKYVTTFHCKSIYVNMQEEVESAKNKNVNNVSDVNKQVQIQKKDRFTPLKTYSANISKNSMPTNSNVKPQISPFIKEKANRYTHNGKFANFIMLQVVDRKKVDKQYALSYSDYAKKMKNEK